MAKLRKAFFSEDGCVLFFWLDTGTLEWILLPDIETDKTRDRPQFSAGEESADETKED